MMTQQVMDVMRMMLQEHEAQERELLQLRQDIERMAVENNELCDELNELRAQR